METELKLMLDAAAEARLRARLARGDLAGRSRTVNLHTVYFDTQDGALRSAGMALRLRRQGRVWVQTVKAARQMQAGLSRAEEVECAAPGGRVDLAAIPDADLRARVLDRVGGHALTPVVETAMRRTIRPLTLEGAEIELAIDVGEIRAQGLVQPHREVELELKSGGPGALFAAARVLFPDGGLRFSDRSKAERGFDLLAGIVDDGVAPRAARAVPLTPRQTVETGARDVLAECLAMITRNMLAVVADAAADGPHQLRIGLRRLRTALELFAPVLGGPAVDRLRAEARWLAGEVGALRDLDVARADILAPAAATWPDEPGWAVLEADLIARAGQRRAGLVATLQGARAQTFVFDLAEMIATRGWLAPEDYGQSARLARPMADLAPRALARCWTRVDRRARGIADLDIIARHDLRKACKKLRYALEFLAPLLPPKRLGAFLARLRRLQTVFGALNDAAMAEALFLAPQAPGAGDPAAQRAVGRILGAAQAHAAGTWGQARALWADLAGMARPWR